VVRVSAARTLATARRVLLQLRHDPRTIALLILVPCGLETLLRLIYAHRLTVFDAAGAPLLAFFPLTTVFLVTSISLQRERVTGTLERLLTTPLGRLELLAGYALAFGLLAAVQAGIVSALTLGALGLRVSGPVALVVVLAVCVALLGTGLGLLASAFARTEFQVVQFFPLIIMPQLLLCGLLVARQRMPSALHAISDALPLSYAVDGMHHLSLQHGAGAALIGDIVIVVAFAGGALLVGAGTLRRRTD
jgi:ABC-2 type transport system permease protein